MKIKVIFIIGNLVRGGAERVLSNLLLHLDKDKFKPILVVFENKILYPLHSNVIIHNLQVPPASGVKKFTNLFIKIYRLATILRSEKPDLTFSFMANNNIINLLCTIITGFSAKVIISERIHLSVFLKHTDVYNKTIGMFARLFYRMSDAIVAPSIGIKNDLVSFGINRGKIFVVNSGVDEGKMDLVSREIVEHHWFNDSIPLIISVGRLDKQKDYVTALNAFSHVKRKLKCRYVIFGDGTEKGNLLELADKLGVNNDITFLGNNDNPWKYMSRATLFVLSSIYEGFPNIVLEAMACGVAVISTDCPSGPNEIIVNGENGLLVPVSNADALATAMEKLLLDEPLRNKLAKKGKEHIRNFSLSNMTKQYEDIILKVATNK